MKIDIKDKYLYITDNDGKDLAYFEHFEDSKTKHSVIAISTENNKGDLFIRKNNGKLQKAEVRWFNRKKLIYRTIFIKENKGAFNYLILLTPTNKI